MVLHIQAMPTPETGETKMRVSIFNHETGARIAIAEAPNAIIAEQRAENFCKLYEHVLGVQPRATVDGFTGSREEERECERFGWVWIF